MDIFKKAGFDPRSLGKKAVKEASASIFKKNKKLGDAKKVIDALGQDRHVDAARVMLGKKRTRKVANALERLRR